MGKVRGRRGEGEMNGESSMDAYTLTYINRQLLEICYMTQGSVNLEGWEWVGGGREVQEEGDICTPMANSCCYVLETKPTL